MPIPRRRFLQATLLLVGLLIAGVPGCNSNSDSKSTSLNQLTIGIVSYDEGHRSLERYEQLKEYLSNETQSIVQLEPAYNELQAIDQINRKKWDIVFAPPGLAALAIDQALYVPVFPMEEIDTNRRSMLVVKADSPIQSLTDLTNKVVALGEVGSAAGYYLPLYDLYGLVLSEVRFAPTPKATLQWLDEGTIDAGALSMGDFDRYKRDFPEAEFRVLHTSRWIPPGLVLIGPTIERNLQEQIETALRKAPSEITFDTGYLPNSPLPDYSQFTQLVKKVVPLRDRVKQKPAVLLFDETSTETTPTQATPSEAVPTPNEKSP
ncbi:MAG TPA: phosphate/phosphite/phosphonate ABC transporter substrate-binding protein [Allocoleopsis sp.]